MIGPLEHHHIAYIVGGLGIFLYGLVSFSDYLKEIAGVRLKAVLESATRSSWAGMLTGAVLSMLVQSSSIVSIVTIAFVNSGLLGFTQALGLIFGANIGTTITAQIIAFKITEWGFYIIPIGLLVYLLGRKKRVRYLGQSIVSFGSLLVGLFLMEKGLVPLRSFEPFMAIMQSMGQNPFKGIVVSSFFTGIVQSSSATTALAVTMASQQLITISSAIPLVLGANIGTTVTAMIASIGTRLSAKRVALSHLLFNVVGVICVYPLIVNGWYEKAVLALSIFLGDASIERLVANSHSLFNVLWSLFWVWQVPMFSRIVKSLLKGEEKLCLQGTAFLDRRLLNTPSLAVDAVRKELFRMSSIAHEMLDSQIQNISGELPWTEAKRVWELEAVVNEIQKETLTFLRDLHGENTSEDIAQSILALIQSVDDVERWGDHATNLFEIAEFIFENNVRVNEGTIWIIKELYALVSQNILLAINTFNGNECNETILNKAATIEKQIDLNVKNYRGHRSETYISGETEVDSALVFTDIIMNLERVADHAFNIIQLFCDCESEPN
jgi:phosphate:Na+ symporter